MSDFVETVLPGVESHRVSCEKAPAVKPSLVTIPLDVCDRVSHSVSSARLSLDKRFDFKLGTPTLF
jgi:hypothetical protein